MTPAELDALIEHLINAERRLTVAFAKGGVVSSVLDNMRLLSNAAIALRKQGDALVQLREENARLLHSKQYDYLAHVGEVNKSGSYIWCDLVKLRDSEALARGKIAEQMIEIARLQDDTAEIDRLRGENARIKDARLFPAGYELYRTSEINRIAALEAERDALQKNCTVLVQMFELAAAIPSMSDEQLRQLVANGRAAIDAARSKP